MDSISTLTLLGIFGLACVILYYRFGPELRRRAKSRAERREQFGEEYDRFKDARARDGEISELYRNPSWADQGFKERCANAEAFITLCCSGGVFGLRQRLGADIRIVPGMRDAGTFQSFLVFDEKKEFVLIDRDRSTVIQFK